MKADAGKAGGAGQAPGLVTTQFHELIVEAGHDMRNMLAVVANSAAMLARLVDDQRCHAPLRAIDRVIHTGSRWVERLQTAGASPHRNSEEIIALGGWLAERQPEWAAAVSESTHVCIEIDQGPDTVCVDPVDLDLALLNLVRNADEAMPEGGTVTIRLRPSPRSGMLLLQVTDTGHGIAPDLVARIFERSFTTRADGAGRKRGLGLAQVRAYCERCGGSVQANSVLGQGSTFTIRLPLHPRPTAPHRVEPAVAAADGVFAAGSLPADGLRSRPAGRSQCSGSEVLRWSGLHDWTDPQTDRVEFAMRRVPACGTLIAEGWPLQRLYCVAGGTFKLARYDLEGYEQVLGFCLRGDLLGLDGLSGQRYESSVIALEDSYVAVMPFLQFCELARRLPAFERLLHHAVGAELSRRGETQYVMASPSSEVRIARFLLAFARRQSQLGVSDRRFRFGMTRREIASCLGIAHETVTRALAALAQAGCIRVSHRDIEIVDSHALMQLQRPTRGTDRRPARALRAQSGLTRAPIGRTG
jgi:CRP/FNR family transcriptional regulator, anaerobic regulatory protein